LRKRELRRLVQPLPRLQVLAQAEAVFGLLSWLMLSRPRLEPAPTGSRH
jgi:hypothetical protein